MVWFNAPKAGAYKVRVWAYGNGTYDIGLIDLLNAPDPDPDSPDDDGEGPPGDVIDTQGDNKRVKVTLKRDHVYHIGVEGADTDAGTLTDPVLLGLYNQNGDPIYADRVPGHLDTYDNDSGIGRNSLILFQAPVTANYYVEVGGKGAVTGSFIVRVTDITDTSTSEVEDIDFAHWDELLSRAFRRDVDALPGWLTPGISSTGETIDGPETYLLNVEPGRRYRVELKAAQNGDGTLPNPHMHLGGYQYINIDEEDFRNTDSGLDFLYDDIVENRLDGRNVTIEFTARPRFYSFGIFFQGTYAVMARSIKNTPGGTYTVVMTDITDSDDNVAEEYPHPDQTLEAGGSVNGTIDAAGDEDWWLVRLEAGRSYRIELSGSESGGGSLADPFINEIRPGIIQGDLRSDWHYPWNDDRSATEKDSEIAISASQSRDGLFFVDVASADGGTGAYTLTLTDTSGTAPTPPAGSDTGCVETIPHDDLLDGSEQVTDTWHSGCEAKNRDGRYARFYTFTLEEEAQVNVRLESDPEDLSDFKDTYLFLLRGDEDGSVIKETEEQETEFYISHISPTVLPAGTYTVEATTVDVAETGEFQLAIDPGPVSVATDDDCVRRVFGLRYGRYDDDRDFSTSCESSERTGTLAYWYTFTLQEEQVVTAFIQVGGGGGVGGVYGYLRQGAGRAGEILIRLDDAQSSGANQETVSARLPASAYTLEVSTVSPTRDLEFKGYGKVEIDIGGASESTTTDEVGRNGDCGDHLYVLCSVAVGGSSKGRITYDDVDNWAVGLTAGATYVIDVKGNGDKSGGNDNAGTLPDPHAALLGPDGAEVAQNGNVANNNKNSRITYNVPGDAGGKYHLKVSEYDFGTGTYTVSVLQSQLQGSNTPASGAPGITGLGTVGETLTATTSPITDDDGLDNAVFAYQWVRFELGAQSGTDIAGATGPTYILAADDEDKVIKVRVTFTDDAGNEESVTSSIGMLVSAALPELGVPDAPGAPDVSPHAAGALAVSWDAPTSDGGSAITGYKVQWKEAAGSWDTPADVSEALVTGTGHTITGLTDGTAYSVRVLAINDNGEGSTSEDGEGTPHETVPPELSGASVDGAALTLSYNEALDEDSNPAPSAFTVTVSGNARAVDSVDVSGSDVTLTLASAVTSEDTVTVSYAAPTGESDTRLRDAVGNAAASFTGQTATNETAPPAAQAPDAPGRPDVARHASGSLSVSWDAPSSDGGSPITGYKVQWKEAANSWDTPADVTEAAVTGTSHTIAGLTDGVEYSGAGNRCQRGRRQPALHGADRNAE